MRRRSVFTLAALAVSGCTAPSGVASVSVSDDGFAGTAITGGYALPDVELTDTSGKPFNLRTSPTTDIVVLFFGYTNCPDVCTGIVTDIATARRRMADQELAAKITLIMVTTDPARDTPEAMKEYLGRIDDNFIGLTGDIDTIVGAANAVGVAIEEGKKLPNGGYEVDHGTQVQGFGTDRTLSVVWTTGTSIADYKHDFTTLAEQA